jgi:hypothetical protein
MQPLKESDAHGCVRRPKLRSPHLLQSLELNYEIVKGAGEICI